MGFFDSIVGAVANDIMTKEGASNPLVGALGGLVTQNGGVEGLMQKFSQGGLDSKLASWVGAEAGQAVTPQEIESVLGSGQVKEVAAKLGVDPGTASTFLAQHLPMIIGQLTPNGQVQPGQDHHAVIASMLPTLLQGFQNTVASAGAATAPPAASS